MPCCLESFWLYNHVNWWTSHENWFKSFHTVEAFNVVDSVKSFNLGAPVKNQLNWIDKIKLFFSSHFKVWQDLQTSSRSQQPDSPEEAPESTDWFPSTGSQSSGSWTTNRGGGRGSDSTHCPPSEWSPPPRAPSSYQVHRTWTDLPCLVPVGPGLRG